MGATCLVFPGSWDACAARTIAPLRVLTHQSEIGSIGVSTGRTGKHAHAHPKQPAVSQRFNLSAPGKTTWSSPMPPAEAGVNGRARVVGAGRGWKAVPA